jgi:hypothetical protein
MALDEAGLEAGEAAEGAEKDEGASAPASSEPRSPLPPAVVVVATCSVGVVEPVAMTGASIDEVGSVPSTSVSGPVPVPACASAGPALEPIPRPVDVSASPPMPEPAPVPTPGAAGLSVEPEGNNWLVTFESFGSCVAGVALLEPGPGVWAELGVGAAVGPATAVGVATGAAVPGRSEATVAGRSGALVDSEPGVAEDSGRAGVGGGPLPAEVAEDALAAGVADGSGPAGVDAESGVEAGCAAATSVAWGDDALRAPGEPEAPPPAEVAARAESAGGEPAAVSAEDLDR